MWIENLEIIILQMEIEFVKEEWNDLNEDNKSWIIN